MGKEIVESFKEKTNKSINYYKEELKGIRTGRATVALFEGIKVDYYGTMTTLPGVATLAVPDARTVTITPWEPSLIKEIEKAIQSSQMGFNPSNDGKIIRIPFPQLNEERRRELVKVIQKIAEGCKVAIRNERRDANDKLKKTEKDKAITEDESRRLQDEVQAITDKVIKNIDDITALKEKEVMEI